MSLSTEPAWSQAIIELLRRGLPSLDPIRELTTFWSDYLSDRITIESSARSHTCGDPFGDEVILTPLLCASNPIGRMSHTRQLTKSNCGPNYELIDVTARILSTTGTSPPQPDENARLASLAEFCAGAGHEINNPLGTILGRIQLLLASETRPDIRESYATIASQAERIRDMIGDLMVFARPPIPQRVHLNLVDVVNGALVNWRNRFPAIEWAVAAPAPLPAVMVDRAQFLVVLDELYANAHHAVQRVVRPRIETRMEMDKSNLSVRIVDNGAGFSESEKPHLFDPFFSARQSGRGLGFGLSKCWRIITIHGGSISIERSGDQTIVSTTWLCP